ncbi:MAG: hypothetical protein HQK49_03130 [Oligoflexia bacterium]|nr:hypothetical protein [Oligoflexia bacterium]
MHSNRFKPIYTLPRSKNILTIISSLLIISFLLISTKIFSSDNNEEESSSVNIKSGTLKISQNLKASNFFLSIDEDKRIDVISQLNFDPFTKTFRGNTSFKFEADSNGISSELMDIDCGTGLIEGRTVNLERTFFSKESLLEGNLKIIAPKNRSEGLEYTVKLDIPIINLKLMQKLKKTYLDCQQRPLEIIFNEMFFTIISTEPLDLTLVSFQNEGETKKFKGSEYQDEYVIEWDIQGE